MSKPEYSKNSPGVLQGRHKELMKGVEFAKLRGINFAWAVERFKRQAALLERLIFVTNLAEGKIVDQGIWIPLNKYNINPLDFFTECLFQWKDRQEMTKKEALNNAVKISEMATDLAKLIDDSPDICLFLPTPPVCKPPVVGETMCIDGTVVRNVTISGSHNVKWYGEEATIYSQHEPFIATDWLLALSEQVEKNAHEFSVSTTTVTKPNDGSAARTLFVLRLATFIREHCDKPLYGVVATATRSATPFYTAHCPPLTAPPRTGS